jgi:hypothetical protein
MKYLAQILIRPNSETHEITSSRHKFYTKFKGLFIKKETKIIKESFSVPDFLIKLNLAMKSLGINNLVRISHDGVDFYLDKEHKSNDLDEAIQEFGFLIRNSFERFFEEISVIFEYSEEEIDYMLELSLQRIHPVGEYPIRISFSGLPQKHNVPNVQQRFRLFVDKVEQSLHKYMEVSDITISFTKKDESTLINQNEVESKPNSSKNSKKLKDKCIFFPLYGIILGETKVSILAKMGNRAKDYDSDKKLYKYYTVNDVRFWFTNDIADHMYITYTDPIPQQWRNCGFDWSLSYSKWLALLEKLGFFISVAKNPVTEWYNGKKSLSAEIMATKRINPYTSIIFEFDFSYSQISSVDADGTLYSIRVKAD